MKKIIIVLTSALVIFAVTLIIMDNYVMDKAVETEDSINDIILNDLADDFNDDVIMTQESVTSFLSGNFICHYKSTDLGPEFTIADEILRTFPSWIRGNMRDFLRVNPFFKNAVFFVDDSICQRNQQYGFQSDKGEGMVIYANTNDDDLPTLSSYNFMQSASYQKLKETRKSIWALPSASSPVYGKILIYYVPVRCQDGSFFGAFAINLDIDDIRAKIIKHLPYGKKGSEMILVEEQGNIIASYPKEYEKYHTIDKLKKVATTYVDATLVDKAGQITSSFYHDKQYFYYLRSVAKTNWHIYTLCDSDELYEDAINIRYVILFTSFLGFFLMLICYVVVSHQVNKHLKAKAAAEEEIRMAANVQMSMLKPTEFQTSSTILKAYLLPAKSAGGDLYDYIEQDGKLIFCIGDVSGKGMPAALFMTQVVSLFRNAVVTTTDPARITSNINNVLSQNNPDMTFCTLFVGVVDGTTLQFCNAGHNKPIIGNQYVKVRPNVAVGLMSDFPYQTETRTLSASDSILLYTDGVTEAKNRVHACFGEKRLIDSIQKEGSIDIPSILSSVNSFVSGYEQSDDITLLHIKLK